MTTMTLEIYGMHCSTALRLADWLKKLLLDRNVQLDNYVFGSTILKLYATLLFSV